MPTFPSINTLTTKQVLSGDEVIQVSATEKVTLKSLVEQLSPNALTKALTGFVQGNPGVINNQITATDTIISAFQKIMARVGNSQYALFPSASGTGIIIFTKLSEGDVVLVFGPDNYAESNDPNLYIWYGFKSGGFTASDNTSPASLEAFAKQASPINLTTMDKFSTTTSTGIITLKPGDCVFHTQSSISVVLDSEAWGNAASNTAMVVCTGAPLTNNITSNSTSDVLHFSEGFNLVTSEDYVAITIQVMKRNDTKHFFINKCAYSTS